MKRNRQKWLEWVLLGVIGVVCAGLTFLQYRWTGDLSKAERAQLQAGLNEQVKRAAVAFDDEIRESCTALLPRATEIDAEGWERAHQTRYAQWVGSHEPRLFTRIGVVLPRDGAVQLFGFDPEGRIAPMPWPAGWEGLRGTLAARVAGTGRPPAVSPDSWLVELPVFGRESGGHREGRTEMEWMIFEISEDYVRHQLLPGLISEYLNVAGDDLYDVSVSWGDSGRGVVYSTRRDGASVTAGADAVASTFALHFGQGRRGRSGPPREDTPEARWVLAVRHQDGSLDAAVARARNRNLITSVVLIAMLAGAAWALVRYTARSRRLADIQFRFAAGVSHDLRTPLTAIRGAAFNLTDGVVTDPVKISHYANLILRNAEELTSMIENVLDFSSSLHSAPREERREKFAVGDLIEHAAAITEQEIEKAGCRIEVNIAPDLPALTGDPAALDQAFRNLITNAVRHAGQGRWVGISAARYASGVEVRVCDRGPGIPESEQARVFDAFYRGEASRTANVRGTGLGLSIVKDTVERHGGTITVQNSSAGGAQFTVRLPAAPEAT